MPILRFIVLLVATACLTQLQTNLHIQDYEKGCDDGQNAVSSNFTTQRSSLMQLAPAFGILAGLLPISVTLLVHSKKRVILVVGALSTVATVLVPLSERVGFSFRLLARITQGVGFGVIYPTIATITWEWAALREHGLFLAVMTGFPQLASIYLIPVAGTMCDSGLGMTGIYSFMAMSSLLLFALFAFFYQDRPSDHPMIYKKELQAIEKDRGTDNLCSSVPYSAIFSSKTVWSCWLSGLAEIVTLQFIITFFNQNFTDLYRFEAVNIGLLLLLFLFRIFGGVSSDAIKCLSETSKLRIFNTLSLVPPALLLITLQFVPTPRLGVTVLLFASFFISLSPSGFYKCITLHARQHDHFVMIMLVLIHSLCSLIIPSVVNFFSLNNRFSSWSGFACLVSVLQILAAIAFIIWADAEPAEFTKKRDENKRPELDLIDFWQE